MKITAIIPAYNEGKNIDPNLKLLTQTNKLSEIIVVNNASKDNTAEIVKKYPKIKLINLKNNLGKTRAVLNVAKQAKHNHLLLYDADLQGMKAE
jgi:glycosyltransferase involved in cell wall biosynthesis